MFHEHLRTIATIVLGLRSGTSKAPITPEAAHIHGSLFSAYRFLFLPLINNISFSLPASFFSQKVSHFL